jgi:hypothetical protein
MQGGSVPDERGSIPQRSTVRFSPNGSNQGLVCYGRYEKHPVYKDSIDLPSRCSLTAYPGADPGLYGRMCDRPGARLIDLVEV